jgi:Bifunctional DNA primase/polymerase, N-terminal/DnaB-like helicase C terminal domain
VTPKGETPGYEPGASESQMDNSKLTDLRSNATAFLDSALELAARGFAVFPLQPRSKEPYKGSRGFVDATTDADQIRAWWTRAPDSNVGVRPPADVLALDVDPRNGGHETLQALEAEHGALPDTLTARTGGGGLHAFFRVPAGLSWPKELADGIDLKGNRSYVLAAPSIHPDTGKLYEWITPLDTPLAEAPAWVVAKGYARTETVVDEDEGEEQPEAAVARLVAQLEPHFVGGKKHHMAFALGGWLRQRGWNSADAARVVQALPSKNPRARAKDAVDGYRANQGWRGLQDAIGATAAAELDASTPNVKRERELADMQALRAMMPAQAPAPAVAPSAAVPSKLVDRLRRRPVAIFESVLSTGVPSLDAALTFGGVPVSKNIVIGGAPDAGKTALALQMAEAMAAAGAAVAWVAVDEDADDIDARRLQSLSFPRHLAASGVGPGGLSEADVERVERELGGRAFHVFENIPVEDAFAELARLYPDRLRVVVIDSLQTVHSRRSLAASSPRERIDTLIGDLKAAQLAHPALWIATSELARAAYRSREQSENVDPMAAAKESGAIEYAAKLLLVLRSEGEDVVSVEIPKNKLGSKSPLRLRLDRATLRFHSAPGESVSEQDAKVLAAIVGALTPREGGDPMFDGLGFEVLKSRVRNAGASFRNGAFRDLCERLAERGTIERYGRGGYRLTPQVGSGEALPPLADSLASMAAALAVPRVPGVSS